jgi:hypothetical protein
MYGDLSAFTCTVGDLNLVNQYGTTISELNIYEDIESPTGPMGDITVIDGVNALDVYNITGYEPVSVSFTSNDFNTSASFDMCNMHGINFKTGSSQGQDGYGGGSLYHKEYTLKICSPEYIRAQGNYINKEYEMLCSDIVSDIVRNYFRTNKGVNLPDSTKFKRRMIARVEHPIKFLNRVIEDSISSSHLSSLYVLYMTRGAGDQYFVYETYENAFSRRSGVQLKLRNDLKTDKVSYQDLVTSLQWYEGELFYRPTRPQNKAYIVTYNMATGELYDPGSGPDISPSSFHLLGTPLYSVAPENTTGVPIFVVISPENNPEDFEIGVAKKYRLAFQSHLAQDKVTFCCVGNPSIRVGSTLSITVPNMVDPGTQHEETLGGDREFLITSINHKIRGISVTPRYLMICTGVKAAYDSQTNTQG